MGQLYTAITDGFLDDPYTYDAGGALGAPTSNNGDSVDINGYALTQGSNPYVLDALTDGVGDGQFEIEKDFACISVTSIVLTCSACDFVFMSVGQYIWTGGVDAHFQFNGDQSATFITGFIFKIVGSPSRDGIYVVSRSISDGSTTAVYVYGVTGGAYESIAEGMSQLVPLNVDIILTNDLAYGGLTIAAGGYVSFEGDVCVNDTGDGIDVSSGGYLDFSGNVYAAYGGTGIDNHGIIGDFVGNVITSSTSSGIESIGFIAHFEGKVLHGSTGYGLHNEGMGTIQNLTANFYTTGAGLPGFQNDGTVVHWVGHSINASATTGVYLSTPSGSVAVWDGDSMLFSNGEDQVSSGFTLHRTTLNWADGGVMQADVVVPANIRFNTERWTGCLSTQYGTLRVPRLDRVLETEAVDATVGTLPRARVMAANNGLIAAADVLTTGTGVGAGGTYVGIAQADARLKGAGYYGAAGAVNGTLDIAADNPPLDMLRLRN